MCVCVCARACVCPDGAQIEGLLKYLLTLELGNSRFWVTVDLVTLSGLTWMHGGARIATQLRRRWKPKMRGAQSKVHPLSYFLLHTEWFSIHEHSCNESLLFATSTGLVALLYTYIYKYIYSICEFWVNLMSELAPPSLLLPYTYSTRHHASLKNLYPLRKGPMIVVVFCH